MKTRKEFTAKTKRQAFERSGGVCECHLCPGLEPCRVPLVSGQIFYEHIVQCEVGGDNALSNCAVLTKTCWRLKTAKQDAPVIAKVKRIADRHRGIRRRRRVIVGSRLSKWKHKVSGEWVRR